MTAEKKKSLTVFKTDRHEDIASIILAAVVVASVIIYMAFISPTVIVHAGTSGKITEIAVASGAAIKKGDLLYVIESTEKAWKGEVAEDVKKTNQYKAVTDGTVVAIIAKVDDKVKKGHSEIIEIEHVKGTLP